MGRGVVAVLAALSLSAFIALILFPHTLHGEFALVSASRVRARSFRRGDA
jgi:hypothetical protein